MTNDEAIRILENAPWFKWAGQATVISKEVERAREAMQMAVDALKTQPEERTEERTETHACDCISRQAAIDHFKSITVATSIGNKYNEGFVDGLDFAVGHLKTMPSVQPEIIKCRDCKHHWIYKCMDSMPSEVCDLDQTFYNSDFDFCSLAERRTDG